MAVETEGIKYIGSKKKIIPYILDILSKIPGCNRVWDGFSGTTRVSQAMAYCGYEVISSDSSVWSEVFGRCYLQNYLDRSYFIDIIGHLNSVEPFYGWFSEHYGLDTSYSKDTPLKRPWQLKNTMKLDAIRSVIDTLKLSLLEKSVLLTSLILALDKVDSTVGHYASYLRNWSKRSYDDLILKVPNYQMQPNGKNTVIRGDVFDVCSSVTADVSYFDPPYGSNNDKMPPSRVRYNAYYHLWKTVCLNDKPEIFGKANRRVDSSDRAGTSVFESFKRDSDGRFISLKAIEKLMTLAPTKWVILSYSSGGRATAEELKESIARVGDLVGVYEIPYKKNVMSNMTWTGQWTRDSAANTEYLYLIEKG